MTRRRRAPECRHLRVVAVETLGVLEAPDRVAHICLDCDERLPADFASPSH